jgi:hypothetical protein
LKLVPPSVRPVSCTGLEPSAFITQICAGPPLAEVYAIFVRSGDQTGSLSHAPLTLVMRVCPVPSAFMTEMSVVPL